ncbi:3-oxo-tetronate kinase [Vibrio salinus]|uniref:3-oxo-tetronate kinase n=1 Tax=Vibrio salinus TaxID=2899784 RepID=UPI001E3A5786|nr:3-oxo-tetronate kinase [Vibrio salinus]MCE0494743.1 four-carbon acid sugar kinase family protein [Vibrio salinus]
MSVKLGVIADDFTGATDIAGFLVDSGLSCIQLTKVPTEIDAKHSVDCVVVSLKSRSCDSALAVSESVSALRWLKKQGCEQFYFKYCSTFDSTERGNIGPVTDALLDELDEDFTVVCPALPVNGRTVFNGYLFVFQEILSDSGMSKHPINPMTESNLIKLMERQSAGKCGLIDYQTIENGPQSVVEKIEELKNQGNRYAVTDAFTVEHLQTISQATRSLKLLTGGSGLAPGIASHYASGTQDFASASLMGYPENAPTIVLSGSCSVMTNKQVGVYKQLVPSYELNIVDCLDNSDYVEIVTEWVKGNLDSTPLAPIVYATAQPEELKRIQDRYGMKESSEAVETFFQRLAERLSDIGIKNFIVAGGETSGAVTKGLGVNGFYIGPQIAPGVPWVKSIDGSISLALKSGNFGDEQFFKKAQDFWL